MSARGEREERGERGEGREERGERGEEREERGERGRWVGGGCVSVRMSVWLEGEMVGGRNGGEGEAGEIARGSLNIRHVE